MANSLTSINNYYNSNDLNKVNTLSTKARNIEPGRDFGTMLENGIENGKKIGPNGKVIAENLNGRERKLYDTCVEMESLLWKQVLNSMKKTINKVKLIDGGQGEEIFSDFLYDEYASMMAKNSGTDIATTMFKQMSDYI